MNNKKDKEEIKREIFKNVLRQTIMETQNTNLWNAVKADLRSDFIAINACIKKKFK